MGELTDDNVRTIEKIHSSWIQLELAGEHHRLAELCADEIELWAPNARPVVGRAAFSALLSAREDTRVHAIEITDRRIRGSNEIAYLTARYKTTFSSSEDPTPRHATGSHVWILERRVDHWVVVLVGWSAWKASSSGNQITSKFY
jgi:ketosteroid isomerase-like protein